MCEESKKFFIFLFNLLEKLFYWCDRGKVFQKMVAQALREFVVREESIVYYKISDAFVNFRCDMLIFYKNRYIFIEVKSGNAHLTNAQQLFAQNNNIMIIRLSQNGLEILYNDRKIAEEIAQILYQKLSEVFKNG